MSKKLEWLECIRGGAILLVVLGHLTLIDGVGAYSEIIYMFHMPLYFAISGFLYGYREIDKAKKNPKALILKKIVALGIPYLFFSIIYILFNVILQKFVQTNTTVKITDIGILIWSPVGSYWFIWVLLLYFIAVCYLGNSYRKLEILTIVSFLISLSENIWMKEMSTAYHNGLAYFCYFTAAAMIGVIFNDRQLREIEPNVCTLIILTVSGAGFAIFAFQNEILGGSVLRATFLRILGIVAFSSAIICLSKLNIVRYILMKIGAYSWYIYLLHSYFLCCERNVLKYFIPSGNQGVEIVVGMSFSVCGCMLIGYISKKNKWLDRIFYPQHIGSILKKSR